MAFLFVVERHSRRLNAPHLTLTKNTRSAFVAGLLERGPSHLGELCRKEGQRDVLLVMAVGTGQLAKAQQ